MGRPRHREGQAATPDRIVDAALVVFGRDGFARAKLAEIAKNASITRPSLLYHFATKERLYEAVVARSFDRLSAALAAIMAATGPFAERLADVAATFAEQIAAHPDDARIVVHELVAADGPGRPILLERVTPLLDQVVAFVELQGAGSVRPGLPVRGAVMQIAADVLLAHATPALVRRAMWGDLAPRRTAVLARALFLVEEV